MSKKIRECQKCSMAKPVSEFYTNGKKGLHSWCKNCEKERRKKYYHRNKEKEKNAHREWCLKNTYNLTLEQYDEMFEKQNGVCAICGNINKDGRRLYVDHDHKTERVRGLLCHKCNSLLGYVNDEINLLLKIIEYINVSN